MPLDNETRRKFEKWGATPPEVIDHGTIEDIRANLTPMKPHKWRMEGNKLIGETEMGEFAQFLPTNVIMTGTDDAGMPVFKRL